ncbi:IS3 family transposase [Secundilactobacillus kimchicus]|uniref:Transposase n=1 Tax=Secundilactobacillus kimchicus JCM 15530 TaxID=1302272 RepID=A0A0R1HTH2_9LACO|nr:IS3 family transposase [Secundilactobacillus kimchicus]KRK49563.1 transposase [Secundilactobacillus kimchicus JCM 15530]
MNQQIAQVICELKAKFKLVDLIRVLPISEATFFYWRRQSKKPSRDAHLCDLIMYLWQGDNHLGIERITSLLRSEFSVLVNHKRVRRLMHELDIYGMGYHKKSRRYDSSKGPEGTRVKNKLHRRFRTDRPFQKMVADVTEFKIPQTLEKVYLEPIMDLYNNEILTYAVTSDSPNLEFAVQPLNELIEKLPNPNMKRFVHTDQGWQFRHKVWQRKLRKANLTPSMARRATCLDNACIESFFNKLKVELGNLNQYRSAQELIKAIKSWISYYNTRRIQMKLGGKSPIKYRQLAA